MSADRATSGGAVSVTRCPDGALVVLVGDLRRGEAAVLGERLVMMIADGVRRVVVDGSGASRLGDEVVVSAAVAARAMAEVGGELVVLDPPAASVEPLADAGVTTSTSRFRSTG